ncbi:MAG: hypothetical protein CMK09_09920 [Ponticaulis sp.]|nr:hypothetical protein [Ponticaulis sp.]
MTVRTNFLTFGLSAAILFAPMMASAEEYRVCPAEQTAIGIETVKEACGDIIKPDFEVEGQTTLSDLRSMKEKRDAFRQEVTDYGNCVTAFINSYRRPGADATSTKPDEAACAHSWAQDQVTETIREFGRTCFAFNDAALVKGEQGFAGNCYPTFGEAG